MEIHHLKLRLSNAYLIIGDRPVLVDTGSPGETESIRLLLQNLDVEFSDLSLILHTHVHSDHIGSTAEIVSEADCPVAYHPLDMPLADQSSNGRLKGVGVRGKLLSPLLSHTKFDSVPADILLADNMQLADFGIAATVVETPGHTLGSVSILTAQGDAIVGDLLMGGYMGGVLFPSKPKYHYFADDFPQITESLGLILSQSSQTLYVGHGGPLKHQTVQKWWDAKNILR